MFFKYEKRLREYSTPEKVFEYFATNGRPHVEGLFMTASDMMRSVTSLYPSDDSEIIRGGNLPGEPLPHVHHEPSEFFKLFDVDANGVIGFDEFLLFRTLLSMPLAYAEASFTCIDEDGNGSIDKDEFSRLLEALDDRSKRPMSPSLRKSSTGSLGEARAGLLELFFGKGQKTLSLKTFLKFLQDFRAELVRLEYCFYDFDKKGYISGRDFAYSVVGPARLKHMDGYLDKVQDMPEYLATSKITFKDFQVFRQAWERLPALAVALDFWQSVHGNVYAGDFRKIVKRVLHCNLPQVQVDILFYLFGTQHSSSGGDDGHGQALNVNFLFQVLNRHYCVTGLTSSYSLEGKKHGQEERGFLECLTSCMRQGQN
jgi:calcium uptake protein 1, mitochondrial